MQDWRYLARIALALFALTTAACGNVPKVSYSVSCKAVTCGSREIDWRQATLVDTNGEIVFTSWAETSATCEWPCAQYDGALYDVKLVFPVADDCYQAPRVTTKVCFADGL